VSDGGLWTRVDTWTVTIRGPMTEREADRIVQVVRALEPADIWYEITATREAP
jgi:hypothetical protein